MDDQGADGTEIAPDRAAKLAGTGEALMVDVRSHYEWAAGHVGGARHIELNELSGRAESLPRERTLVFYCRSGNRSAMAAEAFRQAGYEAFNLAGGLLAWVGDGRPLEPEDGEVATPLPAPG